MSIKNISKVFSLLIFLSLILFLVACGKKIKVSFISKDPTVEVDETIELEYKISDSNLKVIFSSSNKSIATVSNSGVVTGVKAGIVKVTVKVVGYDVQATISVVVKDKS